jgi:hypothetical protein
MSDAERRIFDELAAPLLEDVFKSHVEDGYVEVSNRKPEDIVLEFERQIKKLIDEGIGWRSVIDHTPNLLRRAEREIENESFEIAATFYALWIEHTVNGYLISALLRKGYDSEVATPLIRELRIKTKITALWKLVGYPDFTDDDIKTIEQVTQARNAYVHYKWPAHDEATADNLRDQLRSHVAQARNLEAAFKKAADALLWNGRKDEIIGFFHEHMRQRRQKRFGSSPSSADPAASPPSS